MARTIEKCKVYYVKDSTTGQCIGPIHDRLFAETLCREGNQRYTDNPITMEKVRGTNYAKTSSGTI